MALDPAWYNALVDDTGDNLTGTRWDKAAVAGLIAAINAKIGGDAWTTPTFAAGNFTGNGSLVWTVDSGDVTTFAYTVTGKTMTLMFEIDLTTLSGTTNFKLLMKIPGSKTAAKRTRNQIQFSQGGVPATGYVQADASSTFLSLFLTTQANFTLGTNNVYVNGQITFEIQ